MGHPKNVIKLNGKVYDAVTGHRVHHAAHVPHQPKIHKVHSVKPYHESARKETPHKTPTRQPAHIKRRQIQHSRTLMRHAVKRPSKDLDIRTSSAASSLAPITVIQSQPVVLSAKDRSTRASHISKSKLISKFGTLGSQPSFVMSVQPVPVQPHPADIKAKIAATENNAADAWLANALEHADSHHTSKGVKRKRGKHSRALAAGAASLALVFLVGVVVSKTGPNVEFKLASSRAGIQATLPGHSAQGYRMNGPVEYAPGQVIVHYRSNSDSRSYSITQKASNWNSEALLNTQVLGASTDYQTIQSKGKTVYLYNDGHATWVDGGIWYEIDSKNNLTKSQLLDIVNSF